MRSTSRLRLGWRPTPMLSSLWTRATGGIVKPVQIGNVMEAYATLLIKKHAWGKICSIMYCLAHHDSWP